MHDSTSAAVPVPNGAAAAAAATAAMLLRTRRQSAAAEQPQDAQIANLEQEICRLRDMVRPLVLLCCTAGRCSERVAQSAIAQHASITCSPLPPVPSDPRCIILCLQLKDQAGEGATKSSYLCKYRGHATASLWAPTWEMRCGSARPALAGRQQCGASQPPPPNHVAYARSPLCCPCTPKPGCFSSSSRSSSSSSSAPLASQVLHPQGHHADLLQV